MNAQLSMFDLMICEASRNAISSPEAGSGASPLVSPDGLTTARSGPARARASRSASQARDLEQPMIGICGRTFTGSLPPADQRSALANRLVERLGTIGSTEFDLIWKVKTTPAKHSIFRLAPSMRRISGSGSIGWRTPATTEPGVSLDRLRTLDGAAWTPGQRAYDVMTGRVCQVGLTHEVQATWATPKASDGEGGRTTKTVGGGNAHLPIQAREAPSAWSTPRASDGEKGGPNMTFGAGGQPLPAQAAMTAWPTPQAGTPAQNGNNEAGSTDFSRKVDVIEGLRETPNAPRSGATQNCGSAQTEKRGALAPEFVFWLMGFPAEWRNCVSAATLSLPRLRRKSSRP